MSLPANTHQGETLFFACLKKIGDGPDKNKTSVIKKHLCNKHLQQFAYRQWRLSEIRVVKKKHL